jgi:Cof subfamily protein (haloacid dehalogenase superfamily)
LDIDGTLVWGDKILPSALAACRGARKNGHLLYICSGRPRLQITDAILSVGFDGVVSSGGAHIEMGGERVFSAFIPRNTLDRLTDFLDAHGTGYMLEASDGVTNGPYFRQHCEALCAALKGTPEASLIEDFLAFLLSTPLPAEPWRYRDRVNKVVFMGSRDAVFDKVLREFGGECEIFRGSVPFFGDECGEIGPRGVHKGSALEFVAKRLGISRENTIAIGDSDNDRKMIEYAALGIAMGNGAEGLKQIADYVTGPIGEDGLARAFEKCGLV